MLVNGKKGGNVERRKDMKGICGKEKELRARKKEMRKYGGEMNVGRRKARRNVDRKEEGRGGL